MMKKTEMTDDRVFELLEAYGAHTMAWPEDERDAAEAHMSAHPERFAEALATAHMLDAAFEAAPMPDPEPSLAARILDDAPRERATSRGVLTRLKGLVMPNGRRWPASAALASLGMGLFAGYTASASSLPATYEAEAENVVYGALGYDQFEAYLPEETINE